MPSGPDNSTVAAVLERAGYRCEACGKTVGDQRGTDYSIHHRRARGMGGTRWFGCNLPSNLLVLCGSGTTGCHGYVESHRFLAANAGWLVSRYKDPATVPAEVHGALVWLTNQATYAGGVMKLGNLHPVEFERERVVRRFVCPVCNAQPGIRCDFGETAWGDIAHTGRYLRAVAAGCVPPFVVRHG